MNVQKKWIVRAEIKVEASVWCYAESQEEAAELLKYMNRPGNVVVYESINMRSIDFHAPRPWGCHECGVDEGELHKPDCSKMARLRAEEEKESQS